MYMYKRWTLHNLCKYLKLQELEQAMYSRKHPQLLEVTKEQQRRLRIPRYLSLLQVNRIQ